MGPKNFLLKEIQDIAMATFLGIILIGIFSVCVGAAPEEYTVETVTGKIAGITKQSIAVIFEDQSTGTAEEILIPIGSGTVLKRVKQLDELKKDDDVKVEYQKPADGKIQALTVTLMRAAPETEFNRKPTIERVKAEDKKKEPQEK